MLSRIQHRATHRRQPVRAIENKRDRDPLIGRPGPQVTGRVIDTRHHLKSARHGQGRALDGFIRVNRHAHSIAHLRLIKYVIGRTDRKTSEPDARSLTALYRAFAPHDNAKRLRRYS